MRYCRILYVPHTSRFARTGLPLKLEEHLFIKWPCHLNLF